MSKYSKAFVAIAAAVASAISVTADGEFSLNDIFVVVSGALGALAVYVVPNKAPDA